ncbi:putative RNA methyltransferase [Teredinibacter turnerae]|uniref:putative RNA methyltransferase n=1 Tax=Teredinibacter turnerae TaxID=2426 RepID=UPI0030CE56BB
MSWCCPKCMEPLIQQDKIFRCAQNHQYDQARQGYLNLLLANQKNSRNPGDSDTMIDARKAFLRAGFYAPLVGALQQAVCANVNKSAGCQLLDLGCGEGYYLEKIVASLGGSATAYGVDISKPAVRRAAVAGRQLQAKCEGLALFYAVASTHAIPLEDNCIDIALNVFAPFDGQEVLRVLRRGGLLVRVSPAERHLFQLKEKLYAEVRQHEKPAALNGFSIRTEQRLQFLIKLPNAAAIESLLAMTPLAWNGDPEARVALVGYEELSVEADFYIQVLEPEEMCQQ